MPCATHRKGHLVGEHGTLVEPTIAIGVLQHPDRVGQLFLQLFCTQVDARVLADEQPPIVVKGRERWMHDQWRPGDQLRGETIGHVDHLRR